MMLPRQPAPGWALNSLRYVWKHVWPARALRGNCYSHQARWPNLLLVRMEFEPLQHGGVVDRAAQQSAWAEAGRSFFAGAAAVGRQAAALGAVQRTDVAQPCSRWRAAT